MCEVYEFLHLTPNAVYFPQQLGVDIAASRRARERVSLHKQIFHKIIKLQQK